MSDIPVNYDITTTCARRLKKYGFIRTPLKVANDEEVERRSPLSSEEKRTKYVSPSSNPIGGVHR